MSAPPTKKSRFDLKGHPRVKFQNVLRRSLGKDDITGLGQHLTRSPTVKLDEREWELAFRRHRNDLQIHLFFKNQRTDQQWLLQIDGSCKIVKDYGEKSIKIDPNECFTYGKKSILVCAFLDHFLEQSRPIQVELIFNTNFYDFSLESGIRSDVVLNVGNVIFGVNKKVLMTYSGYFAKRLASCKKEVEIKVDNINARQFCHFLAAINPIPITADVNSYEFLMKMGDDFECPALHLKVEQFLIETNQVTLIEKLKLADAHKEYERLLQSVIDSLRTARQIKNLVLDADFEPLKESTKYRVVNAGLNFI